MSCAVIAKSLAPIEAADAFARLRDAPGRVWLDSSLQRPSDGRYSIVTCDPASVFTARNDRWTQRERDGRTTSSATGALAEFNRWLAERQREPAAGAAHLPFQTGAIGWLAYDLARQFEHIPSLARDDLDVPDLHVAWYDEALVWDHQRDEIWLVYDPSREEPSLPARLRESSAHRPNLSRTPPLRAAISDFSRDDYLQAVETVRAGIAAGDYYQLNLVQRFSADFYDDPAETYLRLRGINPAPFSAFLAADDLAILCSSPERFIHVSASGEIQTCPIKGTRSRAADPSVDRAETDALLQSPKERAELLMIVDLLRNDLGRVCVPGSVHVPRLHALESFATVHHLVGEVRGTLRKGTTAEQLLRAVFPGGSITGAPKISAMQQIEKLERHRRGIAMGSIGYFSAHGEIDLNIAIRTALVRQQRVYISAGAGIVWDSEPAAEYAETLAKAAALFAALGLQGPPS